MEAGESDRIASRPGPGDDGAARTGSDDTAAESASQVEAAGAAA